MPGAHQELRTSQHHEDRSMSMCQHSEVQEAHGKPGLQHKQFLAVWRREGDIC